MPHKKACLFILFICLAACTQLTQADYAKPLGIKGTDNRSSLNGSHAPWQAIGRIETAGLFLCTGVLISPTHVLTAAHCIWNKNTNQVIKTQYLAFIAGYHRERFLERRLLKKTRYSPLYSFKPASQLTLKKLSYDWAILELASPINSIAPIPLSRLSATHLLRSKQRSAILQAGFSSDRSYVLTADQHCKITKRYSQPLLLGHNCDATTGDSGSPLLVRQNGKLRVVAIHIATQSYKQGEAVGVAIMAPLTLDERR